MALVALDVNRGMPGRRSIAVNPFAHGRKRVFLVAEMVGEAANPTLGIAHGENEAAVGKCFVEFAVEKRPWVVPKTLERGSNFQELVQIPESKIFYKISVSRLIAAMFFGSEEPKNSSDRRRTRLVESNANCFFQNSASSLDCA